MIEQYSGISPKGDLLLIKKLCERPLLLFQTYLQCL